MSEFSDIYGVSLKEICKLIELYNNFSLEELNIKLKKSSINIKYHSPSDSNKSFHSSNMEKNINNITSKKWDENYKIDKKNVLKEVKGNNFIEKQENSKGKNYIKINSPISGTFYNSPSPEANEFVKVGDNVKEGQVICIVEAMKNMNEVKSLFKGKIAKILVKNEEIVEKDQALFLIDRS